MEVFGGIAAGITLGAEILRLSRSLLKMAKRIRYARREILKLVKEMGVFADLYEDFYAVCISDQRRKVRPIASTRRLVDWTQEATHAFKKLLDQVRALADDSRYSMLETFTAHMKWFFSESDVKYLRSSLSVARESMRGFSNITFIATIDEEMDLLRATIAQGDRQRLQDMGVQLGMSVEDRLNELKQTSRHRRTQRHAINSRIQEAVELLEQQRKKASDSDVIPETKGLIKFTTTVESYAESVRKRRKRNSTMTIHSEQDSARADSVQPTYSATSSVPTSKPSSFSVPITITSPAASTEDVSRILNNCDKCGGTCLRVEEHKPDVRPSPIPDPIQKSRKMIDEHIPQPSSRRRRSVQDTTALSETWRPHSPSHLPRTIRTAPDPKPTYEALEPVVRTQKDLRRTHQDSRRQFDASSIKIEHPAQLHVPETPDDEEDFPSPIDEEWPEKPSWDEEGASEVSELEEEEEDSGVVHPFTGLADRHKRSESP
ncbi:hypothetical protein CC86DRAFT_463847 [Ophiobolus disseminans]|uniref:Fungal N-terminal domain-containing protein n=1 Tax=Ophiobolus disseminans TaxID=1469910 RepID=A0A6A7ACX3_9PLEO|nr:hypothetical protein CC86DRAFT_463847 [Ophiobolus disseminans]